MTRPQNDAAASTPPPAGRGVPTPCNPATLRGECAGDCGRTLHYGRPRRGTRAGCDAGHRRHHAHGLCSTCNDWYRRKGIPYPKPRPRVLPYCPHDEGEPCDCELAS